MGNILSKPSQQELEQMHVLYRDGGSDRGMAFTIREQAGDQRRRSGQLA